MNKNETKYVGDSMGLTGWLQVAFIVLKLCNIIDWSWVWVLAPLWVTFSVLIIFLIIYIIFIIIASR